MPLTPSTNDLSPESRVSTGLAKVLGIRIRQPAGGSALSTGSDFHRSTPRLDYFSDSIVPRDEYVYLEKLRRDKSVDERIHATVALTSLIKDLPPDFVNNVWYNAQDMVSDPFPAPARQAALRLLTACLRCFGESVAIDRLRYFRVITLNEHPSDFNEQLEAMVVLTEDGRDLSAFEQEIAGVLSRWLLAMFNEVSRARVGRKQKDRETGQPKVSECQLYDLEHRFNELFKFVTKIIKFNFNRFEEDQVNMLIQDVLGVCRKTTSATDVQCGVEFISTVATYGYIPIDSLELTIQVLCGTFATVMSIADETWNVITNMLGSHMQHRCLLILLDILRYPTMGGNSPLTEQPNTNTIRGAVWTLERLTRSDGSDGFPKLDHLVLFVALKDSMAIDRPRIDLDTMSVVGTILKNPDAVAQIKFDEWRLPLEILAQAARRTVETADGTPLERLGVQGVRPTGDKVPHAISEKLLEIITQLESACRNNDINFVEGVVDFFLQVYAHIPDSTADFVITYYDNHHLCYPSWTGWVENSKHLIDSLFLTRVRPSHMRIKVITLLKDIYDTIRGICEEPVLYEPLLAALSGFQSETDPLVLEVLVNCIVDVAAHCTMDMFNIMVDILIKYCRMETPDDLSMDQPAISAPRPVSAHYNQKGSLTNIIVRGLVHMFVRYKNVNATKGVRLYEELVRVAGSAVCEVDARLTAMRLLFRLRADSENAVFIVSNPECDYLAEVLNRTVKPPSAVTIGNTLHSSTPGPTLSPNDEETSSSRSNRSANVSPTATRNHTRTPSARPPHQLLWTYPEVDAMPAETNDDASPVLITFYNPQVDNPAQHGPAMDPTKAAKVSLWLEKLLPIIQQGADWEIYCYVLCHLPSQLANKTAFRNCKAHIRMLRNFICDQLHNNNFANPELPPDIRTADIAVALIHCLSVLVSYRAHFTPHEMQGIIKAFLLGLSRWNRCAKPCIHALSVSCYEMPDITSRFLPGMLAKLSTIITSPTVSVHILEFLSALAKLPSLFSNFVEADFRNIFGIAFRYISHARETAARSNAITRTGTPTETQIEQPDLPQYVLTLAYNVLTTWFLALRLSERPKYVSWIIRGLVPHESMDEQSEACIDMLQRFTYSESDNKPPAKLEAKPGILTKSWLNGLGMMTVQMSAETGVSRVTVRKPAGTSYFSLKQESGDVKAMLESKHVEVDDQLQTGADEFLTQPSVLPSHILLQLVAVAGSIGPTKPILLPDDDMTRRAIEVFDRIPVVDFHKIGIVYAGAGQTNEQDILQNKMGSPDYTDFICGLGDLVRLQGTDINTGGLDREQDLDGEFMYFWKDRTTEIAFHITTMMPTLEQDPQCTMKKRHVGNDFVNIVFNNSGLPWKFGTVPSQFNFVTIVISPEARSSFVSSCIHNRGATAAEDIFYRVKVCCKEGFSEISPAQEPKIVSAKSLPSFVRNVALNASVYSHVFNEGGREHISSIRHRLKSIRQLKERVSASEFSRTAAGSGHGPASGTSSNRSSTSTIQQQGAGQRMSSIGGGADSRRVSTISSIGGVLNGGDERGEIEALQEYLEGLDFSRYT